MKRIFKMICSLALTFAITTTSSICTSTSHATVTVTLPEDFSEFTVIDDKGMLAEDDYYKREGYKMLYFSPYEKFYRADPAYRYLKFILNEDVNYEDVNEKIVEIFKEFYPENNLDATYDDMISPDYANNYKPSLYSKTVDDVTTYTVCVSYKTVSSIDDERVANAKKYSTDFMKKLNEENLISAFYDFGEVYEVSDCGKTPDFRFDINVDIELINKYISENNIDCIIENVDDNYYVMNFNDDTDKLEQFLTAVDIYEATSIKIDSWASIESPPIIMCGKNALEDISSLESTLTVTTATETTTTTVSTTATTVTTTVPATTPAEATTSATVTTTVTTTISAETTTTITTQPTEQAKPLGDANGDNELNVRDCAFIAQKLADGKAADLPDSADYNKDGVKNIRDAATLAKELA